MSYTFKINVYYVYFPLSFVIILYSLNLIWLIFWEFHGFASSYEIEKTWIRSHTTKFLLGLKVTDDSHWSVIQLWESEGFVARSRKTEGVEKTYQVQVYFILAWFAGDQDPSHCCHVLCAWDELWRRRQGFHCIAPAFTTATAAAVGMMDDLVDNEEKNHQAPRLAVESTV